MRYALLFIVFLQNVNCLTQIRENFTDGEFLLAPTWMGDYQNYQVNSELQAQLDANQAGNSFLCLSHGLDSTGEMEWSFWTKQSFSGSSSNYSRFYLLAEDSILHAATNGYYLQMGEAGSADALRLMKHENGLSTTLLSGEPGAISASFSAHVKVTYDSLQTWRMSISYNNGATQDLTDSLVEAISVWGEYSGWLNVYTASNAKKFYLDDVYIGPIEYDTIPPVLLDTDVQSHKVLYFTCSENLVLNPSNPLQVSVVPSIGLENIRMDSNRVIVQLKEALQNGVRYQWRVDFLSDAKGNVGSADTSFVFMLPVQPKKGDLLITELMADPSPSVGLPEVEFIELYNTSDQFIHLNHVSLGDWQNGASLAGLVMQPHQYLVLVPASDTSMPNAVKLTSFPTLTNSKDSLYLMLNTGEILDSIKYDLQSYQDESKKNGGYSLERIYLHTRCSDGGNWTVSTSATGGTPGKVNAVNKGVDFDPPILLQSAIGEEGIELLFDENLDLTSWNSNFLMGNFSFQLEGITAYKTKLVLTFHEPFPVSKNLVLHLDGLMDCNHNDTSCVLTFTRGKKPQVGDLIVNELLFDPPSEGYDFVELYNTTDQVLDLKGCRVGRKKELEMQWSDSLAKSFLLQPKEYLVFTQDIEWLTSYFTHFSQAAMHPLKLPNFPNDSGTLVVSCGTTVLETLSYNEDWHLSLLENTEGVSLERLSPQLAAQDPNNWHSAAETYGFATPGLPNSQRLGTLSDDQLALLSPVISPDNDGLEDVLQLHYHFSEPGYVLSLTIYDANGREYFGWEKNTLVATEGVLTWDGQTNEGRVSDIGQYLLFVEAIHPSTGQLFRKRFSVVVARKF